MKRVVFIIVLLLSFVAIVAAGDLLKMTIYYNNGEAKSFWKTEIDSITYSAVDLSGVLQSSIVTQEIHTNKTIIRSDLSAIDSVVFSMEEKDEVEITPGQEVDLGLSVKWAAWNVGASSPEEYGGYYAWGETEEKSDYDYDTYKYWQDKDNDGYWDRDSNEFINIGSNISGTQYDVATVKWGNGWRMPTKEEIQELYDKCKFEGYTYNGVNGCKVTGPNGNSIFLPAAGYRIGTSLHNAGHYGDFWSGSLGEGGSYGAWYLDVDFGGYYGVYSYGYRHFGHSVRPVRD